MSLRPSNTARWTGRSSRDGTGGGRSPRCGCRSRRLHDRGRGAGRAIVPARRNRPCRPGFAAAWRARCARCGGAVRPQRGGRGAGAAGWLLRVQSEFMRPAFDAVKEVDDFEQPGTERTAGLGPFKELSSHRCAPWGRVAVPTWTGCAGGRFLFRSEILRVCTSVRLCS